MMKKTKKIVTIIPIISILFFFNTISFASEETINSTEIEYFDLETGMTKQTNIEHTSDASFAESYIPAEVQLPQSKAIIGEDERKRVPKNLMSYFPYNIVGTLEVTYSNGLKGYGTGWLFGPNDVATSGHVLYNAKYNVNAVSVTFYPAQNNSNSFTSTGYKGRNFYVPAEYKKTLQTRYDYAFLEVNGTPGGSSGYMGWSTYGKANDIAYIIGYPGDHLFEQWMSTSPIAQTDGYVLRYKADTEHGMSGAAIYSTIDQVAIGIHHGGYNAEYNEAAKINTEISNIMYRYRNGDL